MIGRTFSHYRVEARLGAGGMGEVWRARDEHLHRDVAIKLLPGDVLGDREAHERFRREALALSRLSHPHIVTVFDFDAQEGLDFLVMELILGESLAERVARGPLPLDEVARLGRQIADALDAAHTHGVIHRDLKPGNVMITPRGDATVLDFGLARRMSVGDGESTVTALTTSQSTLGTLPYMAPEQHLAKPAGPAADLWALGAVLYEMATGRRPFDQQVSGALVHAILNEDPPRTRTLRPEIPEWLETLILACLAKEPADRPASARVVIEALDQARAPKDPARRGRPHGRAAGPSRRIPATALVAGGVVAATVALAFLAVALLHPSHAIRSLAVLPLENLSRDADQEYFADGMTDEIITTLAKIGALRVIARSSVASYRGTQKSIAQIARELGVDALVEGSVLRAGSQVRINARLIRAATGQDLWDEHYERGLENVLALQSEVAEAIAKQIQVAVTPEERQRLATTRQVNPQAYEAYLRGRQAWDQGTVESFRKSLTYFEEAAKIDPTYAPAYAGIADAYWSFSNLTMPPNEAMPPALAAARKALQLDESLAEAHTSLATLEMEYEWNWADAEREFRRAIELKPGDAAAHRQLAFYYRFHGDYARDHAEMEKASALDPLSEFTIGQLGWPEYFARRYDDALAIFRQTVAKAPNEFEVYGGLGMAYEAKRQYPEAIAAFEKECQAFPVGQTKTFLAHAFAVAGRTREAHAVLDTLIRDRAKTFVSAVDIAAVFAGLGERDSALSWMEKGIDEHAGWLEFIKIDPRYDPLRGDPRFQAVQRRVGLPL